MNAERIHVRKCKINVSGSIPFFKREFFNAKKVLMKMQHCYYKYTKKSNVKILDSLKYIKFSVEILPKKAH